MFSGSQRGTSCTWRFGVRWKWTELLLHFQEQIHSMMSVITHNCYISNHHSDLDGEWNLGWNKLKPIRPACMRGERRWEEERGGVWWICRDCWTLTQWGEMCWHCVPVTELWRLLKKEEKKQEDEVVPQIWVHELKASCSTHRQTPGPFNLLWKAKYNKGSGGVHGEKKSNPTSMWRGK